MKKFDLRIDIALKESQCTMINPWYRYPRDENDMPIPWNRERIARNPDTLIKLEHTISARMQEGYQSALMATLEKNVPILYVDCNQKGEDDIMLFIFREYIKQSQAENKDILVAKAIGNHTLVTPSKQERQHYIQENTPNSEEMLQHYSHLLKHLLEANDEEYRKMILSFERDITFDGLGDLMKAEGQKYLYLYLDKIQSLSIEEQQRINIFLYTRWVINNDRYVRVKINNGNWSWKTRTSATGHRVESTHDYADLNIYENEL